MEEMKCQNCGTELANGVQFCHECGSKVENRGRFCRECGAKNEEGSKFCSICGASMAPVAVTATVPYECKDASKAKSQSISPKAETVVSKAKAKTTSNKQPPQNTSNSLGDKIKAFIVEFWHKQDAFCKVVTVATIVVVLILLVAVLAQKGLAIFFSISQIVGLIVATLIHKGVIKHPNRWLKYIVLVVAILFTILTIMSFSWGNKSLDADDPSDGAITATEEIGKNDSTKPNPENLVNCPTEEYIIACLRATPNVVSIEAVTEDNDPNGDLNTDGGYYAAVFFSVDLIDQDEVYGEDLIDRGTDAGGCIEAYKTVEDAESRNEYLAGYDDSLLFISGYHTVIGTLVIRTSQKLTDNDQAALEANIIAILTGGDVTTPIPTEPVETTVPTEALTEAPTESVTITLTMAEDDFEGMNYQEAEKVFREMGFVNFEYRTVDTEIESAAETICYIEITDGFAVNSDFSEGDIVDSDSTVTFFSYKYEAPTAPSPVFYSTNDYETAKNGDTGVFSYIDEGVSYDIYWIIDFDEGYVYYFTDGAGETFCDRLKIESGTLNDAITVTYHDGGDSWSYKLHFKYVDHPETLIMVDQNGFDWEYSTTDLDDALEIRDTKRIKDY